MSPRTHLPTFAGFPLSIIISNIYGGHNGGPFHFGGLNSSTGKIDAVRLLLYDYPSGRKVQSKSTAILSVILAHAEPSIAFWNYVICIINLPIDELSDKTMRMLFDCRACSSCSKRSGRSPAAVSSCHICSPPPESSVASPWDSRATVVFLSSDWHTSVRDINQLK
jgi:hypothetical protein